MPTNFTKIGWYKTSQSFVKTCWYLQPAMPLAGATEWNLAPVLHNYRRQSARSACQSRWRPVILNVWHFAIRHSYSRLLHFTPYRGVSEFDLLPSHVTLQGNDKRLHAVAFTMDVKTAWTTRHAWYQQQNKLVDLRTRFDLWAEPSLCNRTRFVSCRWWSTVVQQYPLVFFSCVKYSCIEWVLLILYF